MKNLKKYYNIKEEKDIEINIPNTSIFYVNKSINKKQTTIVSLEKHQNNEVIIKIVEQVGKNPNMLREIITSNSFLIIGVLNKTIISDLKNFREAMGEMMKNCIAGIIISRKKGIF